MEEYAQNTETLSANRSKPLLHDVRCVWTTCSIPGPLLFKLYWIAFRFDDEKKPEAYNPPEEAQFKILVNGFDDPLTTLKLPGPQ